MTTTQWTDAAIERHGWDVLNAYDEIPAELIYPCNQLYMCGAMAGADVGDDGFTGWMVRYHKADLSTRLDMEMECFYAVANATKHADYVPPDWKPTKGRS